MLNRVKSWWKQDVYRGYLLVFGFAYAWFFGQGIPLWDDDFTSWFWKIQDKSIFQTLLEIVSPISTQPQYWGFNERPIQAFVYQFFYLISGYESWSYMLFKSVVYAGLGVMIYMWARRIVPASKHAPLAAVAASVFFLLTPGPMAAHVIHSDLAPLAELWFLVSTYLLFDAVEATPTEWTGFPNWEKNGAWIKRMVGLSFFTYIGYKSKADLKLIPAILAAYVFLVRRHQLKLFALPIGLMVLLAVPWGGAIFHKAPPFIPGSGGSEIGWMWQPASHDRLFDFLWNANTPGFLQILADPKLLLNNLKDPTLSLVALLGPWLLLPLAGFLAWRMEALDKVPWRRAVQPTDKGERARTFALIWFGAILVGVSALPAINYIFRIRYGILTMVPVSLLLAWGFGIFAEAADRLPRWAVTAAVALFAVQTGINMNRSITFRRDLGQVMVAVDQVYTGFTEKFAANPENKLMLFPDFRPYDYRPKAPKSVTTAKEWLGTPDELTKKGKPGSTYVISWNPSLWEQLEVVENYPGCRSSSLFDHVFPCPKGTGTYLMKYIGTDATYAKAEQLRAKGDLAGARHLYEEFIAKHPGSLAGRFVMGLIAFQQKDWPKAQESYAALETYLPSHLSVLYNHALVLSELHQYDGAIERLKFIAAREPQNYPVWINLYYAYKKNSQDKRARETLTALKQTFPSDAEVNRLLASGGA